MVSTETPKAKPRWSDAPPFHYGGIVWSSTALALLLSLNGMSAWAATAVAVAVTLAAHVVDRASWAVHFARKRQRFMRSVATSRPEAANRMMDRMLKRSADSGEKDGSNDE